MKKILYLLGAFCLVAGLTYAVTFTVTLTDGHTGLPFTGACIQTTSTNGLGRNPPTCEVRALAWTSNTSGTATVTVSDVVGTICRVVIDPDIDAAPTAAYDIILYDSNLVDVLGGQGADLSATATTSFACFATNGTAYMPMEVHGNLALGVSNAGSEKAGVIKLYLRR